MNTQRDGDKDLYLTNNEESAGDRDLCHPPPGPGKHQRPERDDWYTNTRHPSEGDASKDKECNQGA